MVSRQAVIEHLSKRLYETALNNVDKSEVYTDIAENRLTVWVDELPSIQPKEKTGKWIKDEDGKVTCNNCYEYSIATDNIVGATDLLEVITLTMKYCPNCGAKMEVKENAET